MISNPRDKKNQAAAHPPNLGQVYATKLVDILYWKLILTYATKLGRKSHESTNCQTRSYIDSRSTCCCYLWPINNSQAMGIFQIHSVFIHSWDWLLFNASNSLFPSRYLFFNQLLVYRQWDNCKLEFSEYMENTWQHRSIFRLLGNRIFIAD